MSVSDPEFKRLLKGIDLILEKGSVQASRARKSRRIQSLYIDKNSLFEQISRPSSPFMIEGREFSVQKRKEIAANIEKGLWEIFEKGLVPVGNIYTRAGTGSDYNFLNDPEPAILIDRGLSSVYIKGQGGIGEIQHFKRVQTITLSIRNYLRKTLPENDPFRVFWVPNDRYDQANKNLIAQQKAWGAQQPWWKDLNPSQRNKKLENMRDRAGDKNIYKYYA